jgi:hypothetical protein
MGFFSGRASYVRFRVSGRAPRTFGPDYLEQLNGFMIGTQRVAAADGSSVGWIAGDHILDTAFELEKNIINDCLHFALRVDTLKVPGDLLRAYTHVELQGIMEGSPSPAPSLRQKREARERAKERLEREAADGRFLQRKAVPVLWDGLANELHFGATSLSAIERMVTLFQQTFNRKFEMLSAGRQAFLQAEARNQMRAVDDASPSAFVQGFHGELAWAPDEANRDFLGNEFLLWLWFYLETEGDTLKLMDDSEATVMLARTLSLECPRGQTGRESIQSEGPTRLPEAHRAIQAGKLPRKVGLTVVRHDAQYELTLQAETLAVNSARLPVPEGDDDHARHVERVNQIRHLNETLDLLYNAFGERRFNPDWPKELSRIRKWLGEL